MADLLNMEFINSLSHPLYACERSGWKWPVHDIDVETGMMRIDVSGQLQVTRLEEYSFIEDSDGVLHEIECLYNEDNNTGKEGRR